MDFFKKAYDKEKSSLGFKSLRKVVTKVPHQTGTSVLSRDKKRKAMPSGKRISKSGRSYYEYRKNRTDLVGKSV